MKRIGWMVGWLSIALVCAWGFASFSASVTLVASSGYVFRHGDLAVAIDAFTSYSTSEAMRASMSEAAPPYDVDIILVTHAHFDHFDPALVAANLQASPDAVLVGPQDAIDAVRGHAEEILEDRFFSVVPQMDEPTIQTVSGLQLTAFAFPHPPNGLPANIGFLFELDSLAFFHPGDLDVNQASSLFEAYELGVTRIDVAILPSFMFSDTGLHDALLALEAGCFVPTHMRPVRLSMGCRLASTAFDNLTCFTEFMEEIEFTAEALCPLSD